MKVSPLLNVLSDSVVFSNTLNSESHTYVNVINVKVVVYLLLRVPIQVFGNFTEVSVFKCGWPGCEAGNGWQFEIIGQFFSSSSIFPSSVS